MSTPTSAGAVAIIPVRVDSQRLPGKALLADSGRPLFLHTCDQARRAGCFEAVIVATDDVRVAAAVEADAGNTDFPLRVVMTSSRPRTGSERCAEALVGIDAAVVIDIQGDWPEVDPDDLCRLTAWFRGRGGNDAACATLASTIDDPARIADPNVVKVVRGHDGNALYFSRAAIPYRRDPASPASLLRHIGVYGFTRDTLLRLPDLPSSGLDDIEGLEQLRFLENGIPIQVLDATGDPWGIETHGDYVAFLARRTAVR